MGEHRREGLQHLVDGLVELVLAPVAADHVRVERLYRAPLGVEGGVKRGVEGGVGVAGVSGIWSGPFRGRRWACAVSRRA